MLQTKSDPIRIQKDIARSLENLRIFSQQPQTAIPAFYYSADLLLRYGQDLGQKNVNHSLFRKFIKKVKVLKSLKSQKLKKHENDIVEQIWTIVNSEIFVKCMESDKGKGEKLADSCISDDESDIVPPSKQKLPLISSLKTKKFLMENEETQTFDDGKENADILWQRLLISYRQHRIDEAYALKNEFIKKNYKMSEEQKSLFSTIDLEYDTMIGFYVQFDMDGWIFDKEEDGVTLEYKIFQEEKQIAIRIQSEFNISVQNFLAILCEMDLFGDYVPFCYDSRQLKVISRNQKIGTSKIYIPLLTDRQTFFYAAGYDRYQHNGSVFIYSKTINTDKVYQEKYGYKVPDESDYVRLEYKFFIVEYIPITKQRAKVRLASRIDMKLNFLPQFILNASARKFAFNYFKNIIKLNKNFANSKWEEKVKENADFYMFFKKKVDEYLS